MKKVIIVDASPRKNGNCDVIAERLQEKMAGAEVKVVKLREAEVKPCMACNACKRKDEPFCVQKDAMGALIPELESCDAIVLLSPIYFHQVNGPAKSFIDRLYCFYAPSKPTFSNSAKSGKKAALICSCGGGPVDVYTKYAEETAKSFMVTGADKTRAFVCADCNAPASCFGDERSVKGIDDIAQWMMA